MVRSVFIKTTVESATRIDDHMQLLTLDSFPLVQKTTYNAKCTQKQDTVIYRCEDNATL